MLSLPIHWGVTPVAPLWSGRITPFHLACYFVSLRPDLAIEAWEIGNIRSRATFVRRVNGAYAGLSLIGKRRRRGSYNITRYVGYVD